MHYTDDAMSMTVKGQFVVKDYRGMSHLETGASLSSIIEAAYPKGSILGVTLTVELKGQATLCKEKTKYSTCNDVLKQDGTCPNESSHLVEEVEEVAV